MIEGGPTSELVTCTSVPTGTSGRQCSHDVYFIGMASIAGDLNIATTITP